MKRFIEIEGDIVFDRVNQETWELMLNVTSKDLTLLLMEMQLLEYNRSQILTIKSKKSPLAVTLKISADNGESVINLVNNKFKIDLLRRDLRAITAFLLEYYRDTYAPVDHMHIDVAKCSNPGSDGTLTIIAEDSAEPMSGEEARKLLGLDKE